MGAELGQREQLWEFSVTSGRFSCTTTHSKVRDETPLLHGLVIGGLSPDQGESERQPGVVSTYYHGRHAGSWKQTHTSV